MPREQEYLLQFSLPSDCILLERLYLVGSSRAGNNIHLLSQPQHMATSCPRIPCMLRPWRRTLH